MFRHLQKRLNPLLLRLSTKLSRPLNLPTAITINVTPNCFLKCIQCDLWKTTPEKHISLQNGQKIIDRLSNWLGPHYLFFTGGEPLLNPNLTQIISYAQSKQINCHLNSNGSLIDENIAQKLATAKLTAISISLDGSTAKLHDKFRGVPHTFAKATTAIKLLQKYSKSKMKIYINTVIMSSNIDDLSNIALLAQKMKIDNVNFQTLLPNLGTNWHQSNLSKIPLWPHPIKVNKNVDKLIKLKKQYPNLINNSLSDLENIKKYYQNPGYLNKIICAAGINNFIVNNQGEVRLCFEFPSIGNIYTDSAPKIWYGKPAANQRQHILKCNRPCKVTACNQVNTKR
jgi:MoaA/NifB/PqqE/SkfB family radical SAM enzyme